ncbi:MAG: cupin domain-containing protein [Deltaproteobacteria bacterium]
MANDQRPLVVVAAEAPPRARQNVYPEPFARVVAGRLKRPLGDLFGLRNFGVNWTRIEPGAATALRHHHSKQDEFVFVLEGQPTLITDDGELILEPGTCTGFPAGAGNAHQLVNRSPNPVVLLEVGDRTAGDHAEYPHDDLAIVASTDAPARDGGKPRLRFAHKDGTPY